MRQRISIDGQPIDLSKMASFSEQVARREEVFKRCAKLSIWGQLGYARIIDSSDGKIHVTLRGNEKILATIAVNLDENRDELTVSYPEDCIKYVDRSQLLRYAQVPRQFSAASEVVSGYVRCADGRVWNVQIAEVLSATIAIPPGVEISYLSLRVAHLCVEAPNVKLLVRCEHANSTVFVRSACKLDAHMEGVGAILTVQELCGDVANLTVDDGGIIVIGDGVVQNLKASATEPGSLIHAQVRAENADCFVSGHGEIDIAEASQCERRRHGAGLICIGDKVYAH